MTDNDLTEANNLLGITDMTTFTREALNTLATAKLAQIKAQYRTMQQHAELRKLVPCKPFESVDAVMKRHALNLAKIELMGL